MNEMPRIAVIDDEASIRDAALMVLESAGHEAIAFENGDAFLKDGAQQSWTLAFLDLKMPGSDGFDVLASLGEGREALPFPIVMISAHADVQAAVRAMKLGAASFIEKPFSAEDLLGAVDEVQGGDETHAAPDVLEQLTPREREVAVHLNEGMTNKEVARALDCSPRTVEIHRARVLKKLEVRNVAGLVRLMSRIG
ncbi:response regulator transcription factor [Parvularcula sp. ZS-1/3]|uniref:Response regulator transcription factor n=1 Tax=Parvularcula mediterranea TaxID=2732508 RepID=A0A7Y3RLE5_9PROT|nr:response regulator [Parvularcula mediterranea]NNU16165.1 response regulator transcription factor [Parvularcula mediterranea]